MVQDRDCCVWSRARVKPRPRTKKAHMHMRARKTTWRALMRGNTPPFVNAPFGCAADDCPRFVSSSSSSPQLVSHSVISIQLGFYGRPDWPGAPVPLRGL